MITGTTSGGFAFEIAEEALDDMELLDALVELENGSLEAVSVIGERLLGKRQRRAFYEHLRDPETGRVAVAAATGGILEILKTVREGKKF